jgi:hypothetical protein
MAGLVWHGARVNAVLDAAGSAGVRDGIEVIAEESQERVLVQTGDLKNSQRIEARGLAAAVGYTDSKAVPAHENMTITPRRHKNPRAQPKFLEAAATAKRDDAVRAIAEQLRKVL